MISHPLESSPPDSERPVLNPEKALAALGNRLRWQIFQMMADGTPMHAAQVARHFDRDFDGISKHLRLMRSAGLLQSRRAKDRRVEQYFVPSEFRRTPGEVDIGFCLLRIRSAMPEPQAAISPAEPAPETEDPPPPKTAPPSLPLPESEDEESEEEVVQGFGEMLANTTLMGPSDPES